MPVNMAHTKDILDSISEGVITLDKNFKITFFNRAAEKITGYRSEEVLGKFCKQVCNSGLCMNRCPIAHVLKSGNVIHDLASTLLHKNGHTLQVKLNSTVLYNGEDEPIGGVISFLEKSEFDFLKEKYVKENQYYNIISRNKLMREMFQLIEEITDSDASVLIQGESGTGKELIANAIQESSNRSKKPFIKVNCSIFPPHLLASELFGHVKGAYTGAIKDRMGRFEIAHTGTIFLDEVVEMPLEMQLQLLRVLQEGTFERVGESLTRNVDVRIIAATNKNIKEALDSGVFRDDLYYRLNVIPIEVPPLRDRADDIPYLVKHFISKFSLLYNKNVPEIEDTAMDILFHYNWPGNIRELENVIEYAIARTKSNEIIQASKLPSKLSQYGLTQKTKTFTLEGQEGIELLQLLQKHHWNKSKVAQELGIGRTTLWRKMKSHGIDTM